MRQRLGSQKRRVAENDQQIVVAALDRLAGGERGVGGAQTLRLHIDADVGRNRLRRSGHVLASGTDDDRKRGGARLRAGGEHMAKHRAARDGMEDFGQAGLHASPLAGGERDRKAGALRIFAHHTSGFSIIRVKI